MCYKYPGKRCSAHTRVSLRISVQKLNKALSDNSEMEFINALYEKVYKKRIMYFATQGGFEDLRIHLDDAILKNDDNKIKIYQKFYEETVEYVTQNNWMDILTLSENSITLNSRFEIVEKKCNKCNKLVSIENFSKQALTSDGYRPTCKKCRANDESQRVKNLSKEEKDAIRARDYSKNRNKHLLNKYNIGQEEYLAILDAQGSKCKICNKPYSGNNILVVDHCHVTNRIRGLLCQDCNIGIGKLGDYDPQIPLNAILYLSNNDGWMEPHVNHIDSGIPSKSKDYYLRKKFGITLEDYLDFHTKQFSCCGICKKSNPFSLADGHINLAVDHCHETNKIRGLLCFKCNSGIGYFKDNSDILRNAATYLESFHKVD